MTDSQQLEKEEAAYLSQIEQQYLQLSNYVNSLGVRVFTPDELLGLINYFQDNEKYFMSYVGVAQQLNEKGRSQLITRLNQILNEVRNCLRIYREMYQSSLNHQRIREGIINDVNRHNTNTILQVNENRQKTAEKTRRMWDDVIRM